LRRLQRLRQRLQRLRQGLRLRRRRLRRLRLLLVVGPLRHLLGLGTFRLR
jgi:hypothetical protein